LEFVRVTRNDICTCIAALMFSAGCMAYRPSIRTASVLSQSYPCQTFPNRPGRMPDFFSSCFSTTWLFVLHSGLYRMLFLCRRGFFRPSMPSRATGAASGRVSGTHASALKRRQVCNSICLPIMFYQHWSLFPVLVACGYQDA
jgi:hypothetical protein